MKNKLSKLYKLSPEFLNPQLTNFKLIKKVPSVSLHRDDLATFLKKTEWNIDFPIKIEKNFKFKNFVESFSFLSNLAHFSEELDHHAFIQNVYDKVKIELNTHDCNGISIKDVLLANILDHIENQIKIKSPISLTDVTIYLEEMEKKQSLKNFLEGL